MSYGRLFGIPGSDTPATAPTRVLEGIKAVTFDAGGTLMYTDPPAGIAYAQALQRRGLAVDPEVIQQRFLQTFKAATERPRERIDLEAERQFWRGVVAGTFDGHCPPELFEEVFAELWEGFASARYWRLFADAVATVEAVRRRGYRTFILSNADTRFRRTFNELGIRDLFEEMFISCEIGWEKPHVRIFTKVRERIGVAAQEILHVGDSVHHDGAAAVHGWHTLILGRDISRLGDLLAWLPDA
jgi:putative hydrolase of the HAD superfamily